MKRSTTTPLKKVLTSSALVTVAAVMAFSAAISVIPKPASADRFDEQIRALERQVSGYQDEASKLQARADTLQNKVNSLRAQINALQAQIEISQAKYNKLQNEIEETEKKIDERTDFLGKTLAALYVESSVSPIEIFASSDSIGDFIDKQEYRSVVRDRIHTSINEVKELKVKLVKQQKDVKRVLNDQKAQRADVAAKDQEVSTILARTQGEEAAYQRLIGDSKERIEELRAEQRAANAALGGQIVAGDPGKGGYPSQYANAGGGNWTFDSCYPDMWGMCARQCVSYTAWKVHQKYGNMPYWGGHGNANQWPGNARAAGIPTGSTPKKHSVGISMVGFYGHAVWVEQVSGNQVYVSQYNYGLNGEYSEGWFPASSFTYIYFGEW